ncbi:toxin PIN [Leptolyngbya sp. KIOST-1]|uniref:toxin PIN n=1 Tax=Leptolyngbya sp. KIOST-1 TaxID=1229172 RepID=UPI0005640569|nr:toxin PIN [Leptolyngbya sp. KIOST-1]
MPETTQIVINTSPLIALVAAWGDLSRLASLYEQVFVPLEVCQEVLKGGTNQFAVHEFERATWLEKQIFPQQVSPYLLNSLDLGEASVIQFALDQTIPTVCIDEPVGRRMARLSGLNLTGAVGILLKAKKKDSSLSVRTAIGNMLNRNIRLSQTVINFALAQAGELD